MENLREVICENLIKLRKQKQWTQLELAEKLNYSNKAISRWEKGEVLPDIETLNAISELYGIELTELISKHAVTKAIPKNHWYKFGNKLTISLLSILAVWLTCTVIYVYGNIITGANLWQLFMWAVPCSCVVGIVFNCIWGRKAVTFIVISILVWSTLACCYIQLIKYNIWVMFFLGIPLQVGIVLWANLSANKNSKKKN